VSLGNTLGVKGLNPCDRKPCPFRHVESGKPVSPTIAAAMSEYLSKRGSASVAGLTGAQQASLLRKLSRRSGKADTAVGET